MSRQKESKKRIKSYDTLDFFKNQESIFNSLQPQALEPAKPEYPGYSDEELNKLIHFVWVSKPIPKKYLNNIIDLLNIAAAHDYKVMIWTDNKSHILKTINQVVPGEVLSLNSDNRILDFKKTVNNTIRNPCYHYLRNNLCEESFMSQMKHHKRNKKNWIDNDDLTSKKQDSPLIVPAINTSPFELTRAALKERLIYLQKEEKEVIVKFTDAILNEQDYTGLSEQMKNKQKEIMHIKNKLHQMDMPQL